MSRSLPHRFFTGATGQNGTEMGGPFAHKKQKVFRVNTKYFVPLRKLEAGMNGENDPVI
jgi:hypothetical protein